MKAIGDTRPRRFKAKASGSITAGKPCVVEADGDVAQVAQSSISQGVGSEITYESASIGGLSFGATPAFDSNSNRSVFGYHDGSNSLNGTAVVVSASGTTLTAGTPVVFNSNGATYDITCVFDSANNKVIVVYKDGGNSSYGTAIVGTVDPSDNSISFGTATVFNSAASTHTAAAFDSNAGKVVIAYRDSGDSNYGNAIVGTVSGTGISFGSEHRFISSDARNMSMVFDSTNNKCVVVFKDTGHSNRGKAEVLTVSGTSVSSGSTATFETTGIEDNVEATFDTNAGKVVICYEYGTTSNAIIGTVSDTDITFGTAATFSSNETRENTIAYDGNVNKPVIFYRDEGDSSKMKAVPLTVSGTSFSVGTATVWETQGLTEFCATFDSSQNVMPIFFRDEGADNYGRAIAFQNASTPSNLTSENYIGIAEYAAADTETATVLIKGGVSTTQSSLTPGQTYFVQGDGTLGLTADDPSVTAGTAVTSTKLIVKG